MKKIYIVLITLLAFYACSNEEVSEFGSKTGQVQLILNMDDFTEVETRAIESDQKVEDVTLLQFSEGKLVKVVPLSGYDFTQSITLTTELLPIPATVTKEINGVSVPADDATANLIYVLTNFKEVYSTYLNELTNGVGTLTFSDFKAKELIYDKEATTTIPMTGYYYDGIKEDQVNQMVVNLTRTLVFIDFTLDTSKFTVNGKKTTPVVKSITLHNVPKVFTPYPCDNRPAFPKSNNSGVWSDDNNQVPYPSYSADKFETPNETDGVVTNTSVSPKSSFRGYIPENIRGSFASIVSNKQKLPQSGAGQNEAAFTYILVDLDFTTEEHVSANVKYKIYLGGNSLGDMNLLRNGSYHITTYLHGANVGDDETRITVNTKFNPLDVVHETDAKLYPDANCYMIDASKISEGKVDGMKFVLPLMQARMGWKEISRIVEDESHLTAFDTFITTKEWSIKTLWTTTGTSITGVKSTTTGSPQHNEEDYFATLSFNGTFTNGNNAVIALVDPNDNDKIYWSWHLWFTDYNPDAVDDPATTEDESANMNGQIHTYLGAAFKEDGRHYGKKVMDRNLGATITGVSGAIGQPTTLQQAQSLFGLYYQQGRKDPFRAEDAANDDEMTISGDNNLINSVQNPHKFFIGLTDWMSSQNYNTFWYGTSTKKSVFDPSPAGWRVPEGNTNNASQNVWAGFPSGNPNTNGWGNGGGVFNKKVSSEGLNNGGCLYEYEGTQAWYPAAGQRNYSAGAMTDVGSIGYCWSYTYSSTPTSRALYYPLNNSNMTSSQSVNRTNGLPVRCVQE